MNERLQARVNKIEAELARREAMKSTSERQAAYLTGGGRRETSDDDEEVMPGRRVSARRRVVEGQGGDASARIQARQIIAGPRRRPSRSWTSEEDS